jgi:hypothetical protein
VILRVYYKEEFDLLDLVSFHAGKNYFTFTTSDGRTLRSNELGNWIKVDVLDGKNIIYKMYNKRPTPTLVQQEVI